MPGADDEQSWWRHGSAPCSEGSMAARQAGDPASFSAKGVRDTCVGILGPVLVLAGQLGH